MSGDLLFYTLAALDGAAVPGGLAEPAVERDGGVGGADHGDCHADKVTQGLPRALLPARCRGGGGGGGRCEPATEEDVRRGLPQMARGEAAGERGREVAVEEPGERRHRVGDAGGGERSEMRPRMARGNAAAAIRRDGFG